MPSHITAMPISSVRQLGRHDPADLAEANIETGVSALQQFELDRKSFFIRGVPSEEGSMSAAAAMKPVRPRLAPRLGLTDREMVVGILKRLFSHGDGSQQGEAC